VSTQPDFAYAGTVSHGTLREQDLAPTFLSVLDDLNPTVADHLRREYAEALDALSDDEWVESVGWLFEELYDALDNVAPEGYRFGAHEGDGSDFGFWPVEDD